MLAVPPWFLALQMLSNTKIGLHLVLTSLAETLPGDLHGGRLLRCLTVGTRIFGAATVTFHAFVPLALAQGPRDSAYRMAFASSVIWAEFLGFFAFWALTQAAGPRVEGQLWHMVNRAYRSVFYEVCAPTSPPLPPLLFRSIS